jgi:hypothetical protein
MRDARRLRRILTEDAPLPDPCNTRPASCLDAAAPVAKE